MSGSDDGSPDCAEDADGEGHEGSYFETVSIGETRTTQGRTITAADVANFAGVSGDFNRLHTDAEAMRESGFGERIAHGALVFSVMTGLLWQARPPAERDAIVAFYGVDRLRFRAPVYLGDTVHVEVEVTDKERRDHSDATGLARHEATVVNGDGEPVLSCELLVLLR